MHSLILFLAIILLLCPLMHACACRTPHRKHDALHVPEKLQHEDSEGVWNELAHYRASCDELKKQMYVGIYKEGVNFS